MTNEAQATTAPWIESNALAVPAWPPKGPLREAARRVPRRFAAAEAFTFGVDAILNPEPADVPELGKMLRFLKTQPQPSMPAMANIGVVDDESPAMDEVLNMLTRRNLLYRVVPAPDRKLDLTVQLGSKDFPKEAQRTPAISPLACARSSATTSVWCASTARAGHRSPHRRRQARPSFPVELWPRSRPTSAPHPCPRKISAVQVCGVTAQPRARS